MTDYVRIPIRADEHRRLLALQTEWTGQIDSYLTRPSLSDVIKKLLDQQETQTMTTKPTNLMTDDERALYEAVSGRKLPPQTDNERNEALRLAAVEYDLSKDDRPMSGNSLNYMPADEPSLPYHINEEMMGNEATEANARLMADLLREHGHDVEYGFRMNRDEPPFNDAEWQECLDLISKM